MNLLSYMRGHRLRALLAPFFKMAEAALELLVPLVVRDLIDRGIGGGDTAFVLRSAGLLALFAAAGLAFSITAQYFAAESAVGLAARLRSVLFRQVGRLSYAQIDDVGVSALITRMTGDVERVQNGVNLALRLLLRSPFVVFGAVVMAFTVDAGSAWTFAVTVPLLGLVVACLMRANMPLFRFAQQKLDSALGAVRENLSGVRVLRAFGKEAEERRAFTEKNNALTAANRRAGAVSALTNPLTYVILNLGIAALIYTGAVRVERGALTQGAVVALYNYMSQILVELIKLANLIVSISRAMASAKRIEEVLDIEAGLPVPETGVAPDLSAPAVEFRNVSFSYGQNAAPSLENVSFAVGAGMRLGVVGSTGAGKSTLAQLIPRFYEASAGSVRVFGHDVREYAPETLRRLISVVPQKALLFTGTVRDNLRWGGDSADDETLLRAVKNAAAEDVLAGKQGGLDEPVLQGGRNFSGGQRQRLTVARALVKAAPILILDDAASALDYATERRLKENLSALPEKPCVITVSQRASGVRDCDLILVLEDGALTGLGTHDTLIKENAVYAEICRAAEGGDADGKA